MTAAYTDPNTTITREYFAGETTAGATTESCKFRSFQAAKLKSVHVAVTLAGTATTHKVDVYHGTTSIGTIALSTSTANTLANSVTLNEDLAAMDQISVKTGADATGKVHVVYEFHVSPSAVDTL